MDRLPNEVEGGGGARPMPVSRVMTESLLEGRRGSCSWVTTAAVAPPRRVEDGWEVLVGSTVGDAGRDGLTPGELAGWVRASRKRILELVSDLSDDQLECPMMATVNPLLWEIGHQGWFQERMVLRQALGEAPLVAHADALWDSAAVPHDTRWFLRLPPRAEVLDYLSETARRVAERVEAGEATDVLYHLARYAVHHEDWHIEALTYTRQALGYPAPVAPEVPAPVAPEVEVQCNIGRDDVGGGACPGDVVVPGGRFLLGAVRSDPFVFDNEKWAHPCQLADFAIGRAPVTQAEFAAFVEDGGYRRRELWGDDGWAWRQVVDADLPVYWRRTGPGFERRDFDRWVPLEPHRPVVNVSWFEAEAYCRWTNRRLPTEAEWEAAAIGIPAGAGRSTSLLFPERRRWPWGDQSLTPDRANLDGQLAGTAEVGACPEGDSIFGCRQMLGNVWEWTSSVFVPYPGFERDAYKENSEPWFGSRYVLRGGSWATPARLVRPTLRNYFTPDRRDVYAGFRTVAPG
jgi:iron(II)-dependent oxidoreductase